MFFAFDGLDGAGKSSLCEQVFKTLKEYNFPVSKHSIGNLGYCDDEFNKLKAGTMHCSSEIRELLYYFEIMLYCNKNTADFKAQKNNHMILDRYLLSYFSYGPLNGIPLSRIQNLLADLPWPDLYFFVDIEPETALNRIKAYREFDTAEIGYKNHENNVEYNEINFLAHQKKVRELFWERINQISSNRKVYVLDGRLPLTKLHEKCLDVILPLLNSND